MNKNRILLSAIEERSNAFSRPIARKWGKTCISYEYLCNTCIISLGGAQIPIEEYIPNSLKMKLMDFEKMEEVPNSLSLCRSMNFDPTYNCFGYCFADGKYFILNPSGIINSKYRVVSTFKEADIVMFRSFASLDDNGDHGYNYTHCMKVLENGNVSHKEGICQLIQDIPYEEALKQVNNNHIEFIKLK